MQQQQLLTVFFIVFNFFKFLIWNMYMSRANIYTVKVKPRQCRRSGVFNVNFEHISLPALVILLLLNTLNILLPARSELLRRRNS